MNNKDISDKIAKFFFGPVVQQRLSIMIADELNHKTNELAICHRLAFETAQRLTIKDEQLTKLASKLATAEKLIMDLNRWNTYNTLLGKADI